VKFVAGSPLSDEELAALSQTMVDAYGEAARDIVNRYIDEANASGEFVEHATWVNIALGVLQILRPRPQGTPV
jgi:hypothetical protein